MAARALLTHTALLLVSGGVAVSVWTRDKAPHAASEGEVTIWSGRAADLDRVAYEAKGKKVVLEGKSDANGRWYAGTVDRDTPAPAAADGGATTPASTAPPVHASMMFASGASATKLAESLATLHAVRGLGKLAQDHAADFGLADPEGTITLRLGGTEHKLAVGSSTPGGSDRYVLNSANGEVFVIKGDIVRDLDGADSHLIERDLHAWKDADATSFKITAGAKTRAAVRGNAEGKKFWADAATPDKNDETVGNWVNKVERLKVSEYVATLPPGATPVFRVDYSGGAASGGFLEVFKTPPAMNPASPTNTTPKSDYWIKTEHLHLPARVMQSLGEQVEQDLASVAR